MLFRSNAVGLNVFGSDQPAMLELFWRLMAAAGIRQARISDSWNDPSVWKLRVSAARKAGIAPIINITYSISPRHTDDYYAERTRQAVLLAPYRLCLKDPGGLLTPERTRTLVPVMLGHSGGVPIEFHTHCSTGLGPLCCLEAVQQGIRIVNTAIPPLVDDASLPSVFDVAGNLRTLGYRTGIDEQSLRVVERHFTTIARREGLPMGAPVAYDYAQYVHQVPGGMISNLRHQLREVGAESRLPAALDETVRVRADFGYPIMVTPLAQFVGSQAAINIIVGERYKEVTDQVIQYALGHWGKEGPLVMDASVKDKILNRPRAKEWDGWTPPELSLQEVKRKFGGPGVSDEELVLRVIAGESAVKAMLAAGAPREYLRTIQPLVRLVGELTRRSDRRQVFIQKNGLTLRLEKNN